MKKLTLIVLAVAFTIVGCDNGGGGSKKNKTVGRYDQRDPRYNNNGQGLVYSGAVKIADAQESGQDPYYKYLEFLEYMLNLCKSTRNSSADCERITDGARMEVVVLGNTANVTFVAYDRVFRSRMGDVGRILFGGDLTVANMRPIQFTGVPISINGGGRGRGGNTEIKIVKNYRNGQDELKIQLDNQPGNRWMDGSLIFNGIVIASVQMDLMSVTPFFNQWQQSYSNAYSYSYKYSSNGSYSMQSYSSNR